ncbi:hypothetical protein ACO0LD_01180 [Undibacterium sp. Ji83W]|uniref:hypothetical protein n=1 Tax=Undibacterium sp. Ji83W TaxID=3413043 RepID=UPI003BEFAE9C
MACAHFANVLLIVRANVEQKGFILLLLSGKNGSGINILYPLIGKKWRSEIRVIEWNQYRSLLPIFITANLLFCTIYSVTLFTEVENSQQLLSYAPFLQVIYLFLRTRFGRKLIDLSPVNELNKKVAPPAVWLDYMSASSMLILVTSIGIQSTTDGLIKILLFVVQLIFVLFGALPFLNYFSFKKSEGKAVG